jgi:hypothetical protein
MPPKLSVLFSLQTNRLFDVVCHWLYLDISSSADRINLGHGVCTAFLYM